MNINKNRLTFVNTVTNFNKMMADPTKDVSTFFYYRFYTSKFPLNFLNMFLFYFFFADHRHFPPHARSGSHPMES